MRSTIYLITILAFCLNYAVGQSSELTSILTKVNANLYKMTDGDNTVTQELSFEQTAPFRIIFKRIEVDRKGSVIIESQFNMAFLEKRHIGVKNSQREISVDINPREHMIKVLEDGILDGYEDNLSIVCMDIENARTIRDLLEEALPLAQAQYEAAINLPPDYEGLAQFISDRIQTVTEDDDTYEQSFQLISGEKPLFMYTLKYRSGQKLKADQTYLFEFSDFDDGKIKSVIKNKSAYVELQTEDGNDFIELSEADKKDYVDDLIIRASSYEEAQTLASALRQLLPLAKEVKLKSYPEFNTAEEALYFLSNSIQSYPEGDVNIKQRVTGQCLFELEKIRIEQQDTSTKKSLVDLTDLSAEGIRIDVRSTSVEVVATDKDNARFVMMVEDGVQQNYDDELIIGASDINNAKDIKHGLIKSIAFCQPGVPLQNFEWLTQLLESNPNINEDVASQSLTKIDGINCRMALAVEEINRNGNEVIVYEFNLPDLDVEESVIATKRTDVELIFPSNGKERIITEKYSDGEVKYTNEIEILVPDVQSAKIFLVSMKELIRQCKE